jgi:RNA polymerase sigma-70 factor (ECF subfamily)
VATEEKLIELAKEGSVAAFSKLVEMYQNRLLRFLLPRCRSRADAEDAVQDTFVNAYRYLGSYNPRWRFSTWLYRIAMRNASRIVDNGVREEGIAPDNDSDPLDACIVASERENLWSTASRTLSADAYSALWLRYAEDMSVKDVASTLEKSMSWTKVTLMRSRQRLSRELASEAESSANGEAYG